ncbi:MAG TPA: polysaccharide deacetylase family protein [Thermoanaerobaculia bacterium]|nr:polysaccharide deacetylase family protein [Thermoanaerobaculia bacterium]
MNPVLKRLGLAAADRAVVLHADDVGMCHASTAAFAELAGGDLAVSGSLMVPCPWFPAAAAFCRAHPEMDAGVHLTLTSEWEGYRWSPLSTCDPASGLCDELGAFPRHPREVVARGTQEAVEREMAAQLDGAARAALPFTHVDAHMFTVFHPRFLDAYVRLAMGHHALPLLWRVDRPLGALGEAEAAAVRRAAGEWEEKGLPVVDHLVRLPLAQADDRLEQVRGALTALPPGLAHFIFHPALDTPELRAIAPDWRGRAADFAVLAGPELRRCLTGLGIHVLTYRDLGRAAASSR